VRPPSQIFAVRARLYSARFARWCRRIGQATGRDFPCLVEKLFGPVLSVLTFDDEDQAIELANSTRFGLAAGVFTRDLARGHRVVNQLRAGIVWVNTYRAVSPIAPFGGFAQSGYGREAGFESALEYTRTKTVWINTSDTPVPDPFVMR
jgi:aldehyde dehydrogenase (NAD+)